MKVLVTIYNSYGKSDGVSEWDSRVIEDTSKNRDYLIDDYFWDRDDIFDSIEDFVEGKTNSLYGALIGGDWDEPTGREIIITTKEDALFDILQTYNKEKNRIEQLFERG